MRKQQESFPISDNRHFKSDSLGEEELRFKVSSLERELLKLQSINSQLNKTLNMVLENQIKELDGNDFKEIESGYSSENLPAVLKAELSWGARYKSRNPEVRDVVIPDQAEPDHVYTKDTVDIIIEKSCACADPKNVDKKNIHSTEDIITRKLVLTRERNLHFTCACCEQEAHHKMIEKHVEAELYCK